LLGHLGNNLLLVLIQLDGLQCDATQLLNIPAAIKLSTHPFQGKC